MESSLDTNGETSPRLLPEERWKDDLALFSTFISVCICVQHDKIQFFGKFITSLFTSVFPLYRRVRELDKKEDTLKTSDSAREYKKFGWRCIRLNEPMQICLSKELLRD